jgi:hypothetical protein
VRYFAHGFEREIVSVDVQGLQAVPSRWSFAVRCSFWLRIRLNIFLANRSAKHVHIFLRQRAGFHC